MLLVGGADPDREPGLPGGAPAEDDSARLQRRWLAASLEIGASLLDRDGQEALELIASRTRDLADADAVGLSLFVDEGRSLEVRVVLGAGADRLRGQRFAPDQTLGGLAIQLQRPLLRTEDTAERPSLLSPIVRVGAVMAIPLQGSSEIRGVMTIARLAGRATFTETDLVLAAGFASHASVALELADFRRAERRLMLLEDRERIARDLHDHVIQELFAIGIGLESAAGNLPPGDPIGVRIRERVDDLDRTIRRIRTSIFALRAPVERTGAGLRERVLDVVEGMAPTLGYAPRLTFAGPVDSATDDASRGSAPDLVDDVVAVVREALANVAKHARSSRVDVEVDVDDDSLRVRVLDDGVGFGPVERSSGIANLAARADARGGRFAMAANEPHGTIVEWSVPRT